MSISGMLEIELEVADLDESVIDLINSFAFAVVDKDQTLFDEIVYLARMQIAISCQCGERVCMCESVESYETINL